MKLNVAMITNNQERFIRRAIESVLAQKVNFDFEIVIGEDCSTDGTRAVVMDFHRRHPERILLVSSNGADNTFAGLAAYTLLGSGYRVFSRAKATNGS